MQEPESDRNEDTPEDPPVEAEAVDAERPRLVVGMGASAGGLEAFQSFFSNMPPDSGLSFVLVQHLDPHHKSLMAELLGKHTKMPVVLAEEGLRVAANHVYLIAPNTALTISGGMLRVESPRSPHHLPMPVDTFFRSLGRDQGAEAVGIILSGTGNDGTMGLQAIKEHGGLAMAQAEGAAKYYGMPRSAASTGLVDEVLPVEQMPQRLIAYADHVRRLGGRSEQLQEETTDKLSRIFTLLRKRVGHDFSRYKKNTVVRRIHRRMQVLRVETVSDYLDALRESREEAELLFRDLLIGVTQFFRDPEAYKVLENKLLPELIPGASRDKPLRVWVPGCATGEEAYSLAIALCERLEAVDSPARLQIFATDIDDEALAVARSGLYPKSIAADVPPERLKRFFDAEDSHYRVKKSLREVCIFSAHDLVQDPPFSRLDLISCRNVLIYLEAELQKSLLPRFHYALRPDGVLFLGASEGVTAQPDLFLTVDKKHRLFRKRAVPNRALLEMPHELGVALRPEFSATENRRAPVNGGGLFRMAERLLLQNYAPAAVIVDHNHQVVHFFGRTGTFLEPPSGAPDLNLLAMARKGLRMELRSLLHQARKEGREARSEELRFTADSVTRLLRITARPVLAEGPETVDQLLVVFEEQGVLPPPESTAGDAGDPATTEDDPVVRELESELRMTKQYLQTTIEELETSNEELRSSNEELMSMNEELQSSNEELETSREELQSVNEELETVNTELSSKIDELSETNSDLKNLLESTRIATLFLDSHLRIKSFTPSMREVFHLIQGDVGRPVTDITQRVHYDRLEQDVREVLENLTVRERQLHTPDGHWYILRVMPYRTLDNVIDGVVMTFFDVSELKTAQSEVSRLNQQLDRRLAELETILDLVPVGISIAEDPSCERIRVNRMGARLLGTDEGSNVSKSYTGEGAAGYQPIRDGREIPANELPMQMSCRLGRAVEAEEYTVRRPDGSEVELLISASPLFDEDEAVRGAVGAFTDISRSRRDRQELERRSRQQAMVVQLGLLALQSPELGEVFEAATEGLRDVLNLAYAEILEVLPEGEEMLLRAGVGWSEGLVGSFRVPAGSGSRAGFTLASNKPVVMDDLEHEERFSSSRLLSDHGVVSGISVAIPGRDRRWGVLGVHDTSRREFDPADVDFVLAVANVITAALERERSERRLREAEAELTESQTRDRLRRSERLASIGILAAGIAHEINNPVNSILMTADAGLSIPGRVDDGAQVEEDLGIILQEAERCGSIISNVLTFSRETSTQRQRHDLNEAVRQGLQLVARHAKQHQVELQARLAEALPHIDLNVTEVEQVVVNLVQNAIEIGGDGVVIDITTGVREGRVGLTVADNGPGMGDDVLPHIFDPFFTTRRERGGTGLGLSLVFTIVREHGAEIDVRSRPGEGTTFRIEFPVPKG